MASLLKASSCYNKVLIRVVPRNPSSPSRKVPFVVRTENLCSSATLLSKEKALSRHVRNDQFAEKARQTGQTAGYGLVLVAGVGILGAFCYALFKQLLAPLSPQRIYSDAARQCSASSSVADRLGDPLTFHGEKSSRNRQNHISHTVYALTDGSKGMRLQFHVKGSLSSGRVFCDVREDRSGWHYRYLYVAPDTYPQDFIVLQDNRAEYD